MSSQRQRIAMSMDEIRAYLESHGRAILVSNGVGAFPHPMPMNYVFRDGRFLMTTFRKSQKVKNFERDSRSAILVETGERYDQMKSVVAYARAEVIDDLAYVVDVMTWVAQGDVERGLFRPEDAKAIVDSSSPKRVVLRFQPDSYVSWDHSKL